LLKNFYCDINFLCTFASLILKQNKMKKIILSAVVVFAFGISNAQSVKFGAKAGLNLANLNSKSTVAGEPDPDTSMKVGFHVGGLPKLSLPTNLQFNQNYCCLPKVLKVNRKRISETVNIFLPKII